MADASPALESPSFEASPAGEVVRLRPGQDPAFELESVYRDLLNALPAAIYTTDAQGRITFFNEAAVEFAGRRPALGELWCVTWKLYNLDGSPLPHAECPMAIALREGRPNRGAEAIAERPDGARITFTPYPTPLFDEDGRLSGAVNMLVDISDRKTFEKKQTLLSNEVNHRANNLLAVVQSMIRLTGGEEVEEYRDSLEGRIGALARSHNLLAKTRWLGADLQSLAYEELCSYMGEESRAWLSGPPTPLRPVAAQALGLIIHELATNAAKYGALSSHGGRVLVEWRIVENHSVVLHWREEAGPQVKAPRQSGVGAAVVSRAAEQLAATVTYDWKAEGLDFELHGPAAEIVLQASDYR